MSSPIKQNVVDLSWSLIGPSLRIDHAPDVVTALTQAMPGWPMTVQAAAGAVPTHYVYRDHEGLWQGSINEPNEFHLPSPASAACSLVAELVSQRMLNEPELLGLHCGSVEINDRLLLFPENSKAGKSTLTVAFAAAGYRVFGDDVLGLTTDGKGVAMGVAPRLRLPLPDSFSAEFVAYAKQHAGPEDDRYRFVLPGGNGLANFNDQSPVGAIVLLERDPQNLQPEVVTLPAAEGLLQLLCQNFARHTSDAALLARLLPLMQTVPCLLLRYSEPLAGARYLAKVIKDPALLNANSASLLSVAPHETATHCPLTTQARLEQLWIAQCGVSAYELGAELFLIHTKSGAIHRLNATGKIAWQLLQQAISGLELSELIASHFQVPLEQVSTDITALLAALAQTNLIAQPS